MTHVIKNAFILETGLIPPTINIKELNPSIDFRGGSIKVVRDVTPLPSKAVRRVSLNAFGYGGAVRDGPANPDCRHCSVTNQRTFLERPRHS